MMESSWNSETAEPANPHDNRGKRNYVGTKNNYTTNDINALIAWGNEQCTYLVFGREVAQTGTPHLQIYMEFKEAKTMKTIVKKLFPLWLGYRKGSPIQAAGYCKKGCDGVKPYDRYFRRSLAEPENWVLGDEIGTISNQGKRSDLDEVVEDIQAGNSIRQIARDNPVQYIKFNKGIRDLRLMMLLPRRLAAPPDIIVLWGPTGVGKSRDAITKWWPDVPSYTFTGVKWWNTYDGEDKVILEEFRGKMPWEDFLLLCDRNPCQVESKGNTIEIQASKIIICSPLPPDQWYPDKQGLDCISQLHRRITKIVHMTPVCTVNDSHIGQIQIAPGIWQDHNR